MSDKAERVLSEAEKHELLTKLQAKYAREGQSIMDDIQNDIAMYGHVSLETQLKQKKLSEKILAEKEIYEVSDQ